MYKYYRNPHAYSTYNADAVCVLCKNAGSYMISDEYFCDQCVVSDRASEYLIDKDAFDDNEMQISNHPPIRKWQEWPWPQCCDDYMEYICELSKETIRKYAGDMEPDQFIEICMKVDPGEGEGYYRGLRNIDNATKNGDYDLMLHYFVCSKCGKKHIQFDAS